MELILWWHGSTSLRARASEQESNHGLSSCACSLSPDFLMPTYASSPQAKSSGRYDKTGDVLMRLSSRVPDTSRRCWTRVSSPTFSPQSSPYHSPANVTDVLSYSPRIRESHLKSRKCFSCTCQHDPVTQAEPLHDGEVTKLGVMDTQMCPRVESTTMCTS
jgi:hypothetical protein